MPKYIDDPWIVVVDHPYYPEVYEFHTMDDAFVKYKEMKEEMHNEDGVHDGRVYIAQTIRTEKIKTFY